VPLKKSVVRWWYALIVKPHSRYLECGFVVTPTEINEFKDTVENYDKKLSEATTVIKKGVDVRIEPAKLSEGHVQLLTNLNEKFEAWNKRWSTLCKAVASTGKMKVVFMLLAYENSPHVWAHRALVAAEESHRENPAG